ncbi:hypothetical protein FHR94_000667 [Halomonas cerina]|uniref:Uncharacterized protein n=1 Tax=Halomonas cerina TaxID=447424 RepID=A0A839V6L8_9GAMM|nr:hypothetical protein [Halomonas cerina]
MNPSLGATFALRRSRVLLRLQGLGWPSMANPFGGKNIHWMFFYFRLTHGKGHSLRLAPGAHNGWKFGNELQDGTRQRRLAKR